MTDPTPAAGAPEPSLLAAVEQARALDRTTIYWGEEWIAVEFLLRSRSTSREAGLDADRLARAIDPRAFGLLPQAYPDNFEWERQRRAALDQAQDIVRKDEANIARLAAASPVTEEPSSAQVDTETRHLREQEAGG